MIYFTSDLHLNHDKEFIYKNRGFNSIDAMNNTIIRNWNNLVEDSDTVYILGDIMMGLSDESIKLFNKLKGQKKIVLGNHDTSYRAEIYSQAPNTEVLGYAALIKIKKQLFYLSHYPTILGDAKHFRLGHSAICLFGHIHEDIKFYDDCPHIYHVGLDAHNFTPVALPDILDDIRAGMKKIE